MNSLEHALCDYLRLRRGLGYYLERDQSELEQFIEFLQQAQAERITTELAVQWARMPANQHPVIWRKRLSTVRGFARYLATVPQLYAVGVGALDETVDRVTGKHGATLRVAVRDEHAQVGVIEVHLAEVFVLRVFSAPKRTGCRAVSCHDYQVCAPFRRLLAIARWPCPKMRGDVVQHRAERGSGRALDLGTALPSATGALADDGSPS